MGTCSSSIGEEEDEEEMLRKMSSNHERKSSYGGLVLRNKVDEHGKVISVESIYDIDKNELGASSTGSVHQVTRKKDGRKFAMKIIDLTSVQDEFQDQLRQEIDILKDLDHPNIVKLFETYERGDQLHLIMELCTGGELYQKLISQTGRRYAEKTAATLVGQMLSAIFYCHSKGIAHRDIKMANFLLESDSDDAKLKMIDFGFSKMFYSAAKMSTFVGTPFYIAPEVLQGAYNEGSDVWSIGVMAYMLVVGYAPFMAKSEEGILEKIKKGNVSMDGKRWKDVSRECQTFIRKLLQKNPKKRLSAAAALKDPWIRRHAPYRDANAKLSKQLLVRLTSFHAFGQFKKVCRVVMAHVCEYEEKNMLQDVFYGIDIDHSGRIDRHEMIEVLKRSGLSTESSEKMFRSIDVDMSGTIRFSEFTAAVMDDAYSDDMLETVFQRLKNKDGLITPAGIKSVVSELTADECQGMLQETTLARVKRPDGTIMLALTKDNFIKLIRQKGMAKARIARQTSSSRTMLTEPSNITDDIDEEKAIEQMNRTDLLENVEGELAAQPPSPVFDEQLTATASTVTGAITAAVSTETKTKVTKTKNKKTVCEVTTD